MSQKIWIPLLLCAAGLAGIVVGRVWFAPAAAPAPAALESGTLLSPARPLPAFNLLDAQGRPADRARFSGHWTFVFFGFTHCPEACPTTLAMLAGVRRELQGSLAPAQVPGVTLVSVDPERDTPEALGRYLAGFDPAFGGLTGDPQAMRACATALGVPYRKVPMGDGGGDYMMDHSTAILLVDPAGRLAALFPAPQRADLLAADYRRILRSPAN